MKNLSKITVQAKLENSNYVKNQILACLNELDVGTVTIADIICSVEEAFSNAVRFAYPNSNGFVTVSVGLNNDENKVYIVVSDKGVGIKDIEQAVQPFYTTSDEGSGMGFTIMQTFMDNLKIESNMGEGTTIKMSKSL